MKEERDTEASSWGEKVCNQNAENGTGPALCLRIIMHTVARSRRNFALSVEIAKLFEAFVFAQWNAIRHTSEETEDITI